MPRTTTPARYGAPRWDLSPLCGGADPERGERLLKTALRQASRFRARYEGKVSRLSSKGLAEALNAYDDIEEAFGEASALAYLVHSAGPGDEATAALAQSVDDVETKIDSELAFFTHEILELDERAFRKLISRPVLEPWRTWLRGVHAHRPYRLSLEVERLATELESSWPRLYGETIGALRYPFAGRGLTSAQITDLMRDANHKRRREAAQSVAEVHFQKRDLFAHALNAIAHHAAVMNRWRGFESPVSASALAANVPEVEIDALMSAVRSTQELVSHRWSAVKAALLRTRRRDGRLDWRDKNAPVPGASRRRIPFAEAKDIVLTSWRDFSPRLAEIVEKIFDENRIDAEPRPDKDCGAFSHPTVGHAGPFILMNYCGRPDDVLTLAHEVGHAVHQTLSAPRGCLPSQPPLPLAETASTFSERLVFREMLRRQHDPKRRRALLADRIDGIIHTSYRQASLHRFEMRVYREREKGEVTPDRLAEMWIEEAESIYGPAIAFDDDYGPLWSDVPHFFETPFYVWSYVYAECVSAALWDAAETNADGFEDAFIRMLEAGGAVPHTKLLADLGADPSKRSFWRRGLLSVLPLIEEVEALSPGIAMPPRKGRKRRAA
jgi:oligoendopeptidase F